MNVPSYSAPPDSADPVFRMCAVCAALYFLFKVLCLARVSLTARPKGFPLFAYFILWAGMDPGRFFSRGRPPGRPAPGEWLRGFGFAGAGFLLIIMGGALASDTPPLMSGGMILSGLLLFFHFGTLHLGALACRSFGFDAPEIMRRPLSARSLTDFWGARWNRAFSHLAMTFVTRPLLPRLGREPAFFAAFVFSGLIHEAAISFPASGGWGGPLLYFVIQGLGCGTERSAIGRRAGLRGGITGRVFAAALLLAPLPLLFHEPFVTRVNLPLGEEIQTHFRRCIMLFSPPASPDHPLTGLFGLALWLAAAANFCILPAGFLAPRVLGLWEEIQSLSRFNRRIVQVYYGFTGGTIVGFGTLTALYHGWLLAGNPVALGLSSFMGLWWGSRLTVDAFFYDSEDWPSGPGYRAGHGLLRFAFAGMAFTYIALPVWHAFFV